MDIRSKLHETVDENFDDLVAAIQRFVSIDSVYDGNGEDAANPFGVKLSNILKEFLTFGEQIGFKSKNIANYAGHLEVGEGEILVGILGHLDVVPVGKTSQWSDDPFSGKIKDGKLYGRGSSDDKGPTLASLFALKSLMDTGIDFKKRFRVIVGLAEESGSFKCIKNYFKHEPMPSYSYSPDASFPVINAEKGILHFDFVKIFDKGLNKTDILSVNGGDVYNVVPDEAVAVLQGVDLSALPASIEGVTYRLDEDKIVITTKGERAHAKQPDKGKNAILILLEYLVKIPITSERHNYIRSLHEILKHDAFGENLGIACQDKVSGKLTCNPAVFELNGNDTVFKFDIRYPVTLKSDNTVDKLKDAAKKIGADLNVVLDELPLYVDENNPFIKTLLDAYNTITGENGKPISIGGGTYCRAAKNAVSFGGVFPGEQSVAHQADEYISLESLRKMTHIYAEALLKINEM